MMQHPPSTPQQRTDDGHRQRFRTAWEQLPAYRQQSHEWLAALYLLTSDPQIWARLEPTADLARGYLALARVRYTAWTVAQKLLIELACLLINNSGTPEVTDLWYALDPAQFEVAVRAIRIRYYGLATEF